MKTHLILITFIAIAFTACKKDSITPATQTSYADFLKNTEWVGVLDRNGYQRSASGDAIQSVLNPGYTLFIVVVSANEMRGADNSGFQWKVI